MNRSLLVRLVALALGATSLGTAGMAVYHAARVDAVRRLRCFHVQIADGHVGNQEFVVVAADREQALRIVRPFRRPAADVPLVATALHECDVGFVAGIQRVYARNLEVRPLPAPPSEHTAVAEVR